MQIGRALSMGHGRADAGTRGHGDAESGWQTYAASSCFSPRLRVPPSPRPLVSPSPRPPVSVSPRLFLFPRPSRYIPHHMLHYYKFRQDLFPPRAGKEVYLKRGAGKGWPEECPPIRAANAFGFDLLANFDVSFIRARNGQWRVEPDVIVESDFNYSASEDGEGLPLEQQYAWFWEKGQKLPHVISDNVYEQIRNQVKISSFLFLKTDPNELLYMTAIPNLIAPWRAMTALIDTDWYPASYPWHCVDRVGPVTEEN